MAFNPDTLQYQVSVSPILPPEVPPPSAWQQQPQEPAPPAAPTPEFWLLPNPGPVLVPPPFPGEWQQQPQSPIPPPVLPLEGLWPLDRTEGLPPPPEVPPIGGWVQGPQTPPVAPRPRLEGMFMGRFGTFLDSGDGIDYGPSGDPEPQIRHVIPPPRSGDERAMVEFHRRVAALVNLPLARAVVRRRAGADAAQRFVVEVQDRTSRRWPGRWLVYLHITEIRGANPGGSSQTVVFTTGFVVQTLVAGAAWLVLADPSGTIELDVLTPEPGTRSIYTHVLGRPEAGEEFEF